MYNPEYNNFAIKSIYDLDKYNRNIKMNKSVVIDLSGTKYELIRSVTS